MLYNSDNVFWLLSFNFQITVYIVAAKQSLWGLLSYVIITLINKNKEIIPELSRYITYEQNSTTCLLYPSLWICSLCLLYIFIPLANYCLENVLTWESLYLVTRLPSQTTLISKCAYSYVVWVCLFNHFPASAWGSSIFCAYNQIPALPNHSYINWTIPVMTDICSSVKLYFFNQDNILQNYTANHYIWVIICGRFKCWI